MTSRRHVLGLPEIFPNFWTHYLGQLRKYPDQLMVRFYWLIDKSMVCVESCEFFSTTIVDL